MAVMKVRIDKLLVERGMVPSRERAQAMVLSGRVLVNEQKIEKAGASVDSAAAIRLLGGDLKYVGRGGLKLEAALRDWKMKRALQLKEMEALQADIDKGLTDLAEGRVQDFDAARIVARGRKLLAAR